MEIKTSTVANKTEYSDALTLAQEAFLTTGTYDSKQYKHVLWNNEGKLNYENIFIATLKQEIVGVIRIIPRTFILDNTKVKGCCISSVCIKESYRGLGISKLLTDYVHTKLKQRGFLLSYLIARKSVDHYYNKFGYYGVSSYEKIIINEVNKNSITDTTLHITPRFKEDLIPIYQESYYQSYEKCLGKTLRPILFWSHLAERLELLNNITFYSIFQNKVCVGYLLTSNQSVLELAFTGASSSESLTKFIVDQTNIKTFELPSSHRVFSEQINHDFSSIKRKCTYGGHMVKILNKEVLAKTLHYSLKQTEDNTLNEVLSSLKIRLNDLNNKSGYRRFNLSYPDQL